MLYSTGPLTLYHLKQKTNQTTYYHLVQLQQQMPFLRGQNANIEIGKCSEQRICNLHFNLFYLNMVAYLFSTQVSAIWNNKKKKDQVPLSVLIPSMVYSGQNQYDVSQVVGGVCSSTLLLPVVQEIASMCQAEQLIFQGMLDQLHLFISPVVQLRVQVQIMFSSSNYSIHVQ